MTDVWMHIVIVIAPLVVSNSVHMIVVKQNILPMTNVSVWSWGFGKNKTWRGILFVPFVNAIVLSLIALICRIPLELPALTGFILGTAYMLAELPNSFLKRRLGIGAGEVSPKFSVVFSLFDKMDSAIGVVLTYVVLGHASWQTGLWLLLLASVTHIMVSALLVLIGIKSSF